MSKAYCEEGHRFYFKRKHHPMLNDHPLCPHCLANNAKKAKLRELAQQDTIAALNKEINAKVDTIVTDSSSVIAAQQDTLAVLRIELARAESSINTMKGWAELETSNEMRCSKIIESANWYFTVGVNRDRGIG